jgi:hypothetical protein
MHAVPTGFWSYIAALMRAVDAAGNRIYERFLLVRIAIAAVFVKSSALLLKFNVIDGRVITIIAIILVSSKVAQKVYEAAYDTDLIRLGKPIVEVGFGLAFYAAAIYFTVLKVEGTDWSFFDAAITFVITLFLVAYFAWTILFVAKVVWRPRLPIYLHVVPIEHDSTEKHSRVEG